MHELIRTLIELTLMSSAATALALLIRKPAQRAFGARVAYVVWLCVPIAIIATLLPGGVMNTPLLHVPVSVDALLPRDIATLATPTDATHSTVGQGSAIDWSVWASAAWATGALAFLAYLVGVQRAYLRSLGSLFEHGGTLRAEQSAGCPAVVGVLRPRLILPADFESRYTQQEQSLVLAHERVHLHRADAMWNALAALVRCVFWFNPLMHYAASRFRIDQELSCDAAVMQRHPGARRVYADAMLKTQLADGALPAGCHWRSAHPLKERLMMLKHPAPSLARRAAGCVFVAALSMGVGYAAWAAEPAMPKPPDPPAALPAEPQPPAPPNPLTDVPAPQVPPAPPALPADPAPPAPPIDAAPPVEAIDAVPAVPAVEAPPDPPPVPAAAARAGAGREPTALEWRSFADASGGTVTLSASTVSQINGQEVELSNVMLAIGEPPNQTMISADRGRRTSGGDWLFEGNVLAQTDKQSVRADKLKLTRDGGVVTVSTGAQLIMTH